MKTKLIPAPIDEKNVTSDWIESVFDNDCVCNGRTYVGFVDDCVVSCQYNGNELAWKVDEYFADSEKNKSVYEKLEKRLREIDAETPDIVVWYFRPNYAFKHLAQRFYFKEEV